MLNASRGRNPETCSSQQLKSPAFTNSEVAFRAFMAARAALKGCGLIEEIAASPGHLVNGKSERRYCTRIRVTAALWALAARHGIVCNRTMEKHFKRPRSPLPEGMSYFDAIVLRELKKPGSRRQGDVLTIADGPEADALRREVLAMNRCFAFTSIEGCDAITLRRAFTRDLRHGGRWYVVGGGYQEWPGEERRARIEISGLPVVEVDVSASHLTLLHGVLKLPLPNADPYDAVMGDAPRDVVKAYVGQTIGKGTSEARWTRKTLERAAEDGLPLTSHSAAQVQDAVLCRYGFLADLPRILGCVEEPRLSSLRLQRMEADAMTQAMWALWRQDIPSLPVHDSLIVPQGAEEAASRALQSAYQHVAGVVPRVKVKTAAS
jgi:hypothetical protein